MVDTEFLFMQSTVYTTEQRGKNTISQTLILLDKPKLQFSKSRSRYMKQYKQNHALNVKVLRALVEIGSEKGGMEISFFMGEWFRSTSWENTQPPHI